MLWEFWVVGFLECDGESGYAGSELCFFLGWEVMGEDEVGYRLVEFLDCPEFFEPVVFLFSCEYFAGLCNEEEYSLALN